MASICKDRPLTPKAPRFLSERASSSSRSSSTSSLSSAGTSALSTAYILTRTADAPSPQSRHRRSDLSTSDQARKNEYQDYEGDERERISTRRRQDAVQISAPPSASWLSVNTHDSQLSLSSCGNDDEHDENNNDAGGKQDASFFRDLEPVRLCTPADAAIPAFLPPYRAAPISAQVRPSDPGTFARLFPSMNRLSIRHDDRSWDGNMNLRVETTLTPGADLHFVSSRGGGHLATYTYQLFHLRMQDLVKRDFALRRYSRDSGREVCSSKRAYTPASRHHGFPQSVTSALRSVKAPFRRSDTSSSSKTSLKSSAAAASPLHSAAASTSTSSSSSSSPARSPPRPSTAHTSSTAAAARSSASLSAATDKSNESTGPPVMLAPLDVVKLEFGNYARVEVARRSAKRYDFEWWGHKYTWKKTTDRTLGTFSFHLVRDGRSESVAHIAQETQSPNQVQADDLAGGWIPPCFMWISDQSVIEAMTDVAE
ncbi:hypothetical protein AAL_06196 [Moelleriella libera RCEF 2490]|uniref:Uncharacterized protein n=1 Tax=Moelleriella libera RCEF 2490 TaxID=1081109 RepID=A0A166NUU4_9HYPO|nr:hypothetical protein AAL_06196 [Moelleriella libera RCEF 2490]